VNEKEEYEQEKCECCKGTRCCSCNCEIPKKERILEENPFALEIENDYTLHLECEDCRDQAAMDI
jgi:hypothetical protein